MQQVKEYFRWNSLWTMSKNYKKPLFKKQQAGATLSYLKTDKNDFVVINTELEKWKYLKGKKKKNENLLRCILL